MELYGTIRSGVGVSHTKTQGGASHTRTAVEDLDSHIGLRGSYPVGGGNRVVWQFEQDAPVRQDSMRGRFKRRKENSTVHTGG